MSCVFYTKKELSSTSLFRNAYRILVFILQRALAQEQQVVEQVLWLNPQQLLMQWEVERQLSDCDLRVHLLLRLKRYNCSKFC